MSNKQTRISIFGMGYVGCVSGACLASQGHHVIGVEPNQTKVDLINSGRSPIIEKDLDTLIESGVKAGRYRASTDWEAAIRDTDVAFVSVGTPSRTNGSLDLKFVRRVSEQIGTALAKRSSYFTVVIRSTVLPGTVENTVIPLLEKYSGKKAGVDFGVCMNPEFLRESTSVHDFFHPPKTVIGELNSKSGDALASIYDGLPGPLIRTTIGIAEMVKYVDNTFHALKVTFANEIGNLSKALNVDSHQVMDIFCQDTKLNLSPYYLKPGFAFGGSCLPKDLRAVNHEARTRDLELPVLTAILESNQLQILKVIRMLMQHKGRTIGFFGLSFKGGTDDLRESPIVEVIESMIGKGFTVRIYDRHVSLARLIGANKEYIEREIPHLATLMCNKAADLVAQSDVIVVVNKEQEFREALSPLPDGKTVIDLVRIFSALPASPSGYEGICW